MERTYGDPEKEYEVTTRDAAIFDLSCLEIILVSGPDRVRYLHSMVSNDIRNLEPGEGCYATLLTHQGRMESDLYVYALESELRLECPPSAGRRVLLNLNKYLVSDDVVLEDNSGKFGVLSIQGPAAREKLERLLEFRIEDLALLGCRTVNLNGPEGMIVRRDRTGCGGYDIWLERDELRRLWAEWTGSGSIAPAGSDAMNVLRTEAGIPLYGVDMDTRSLPLEFGLHHAISLTKGCYRGQEIVARITYRGHLNRGFGGIRIHDVTVPARGTAVLAEGANAGQVTSAVFSPLLQAPLALAILKEAVRKPGTMVELPCGDSTVPGEVIPLPLRS